MLDYDIALKTLLEQTLPTHQKESIPLTEAYQRILAEDIHANIDAPLFDQSAMDGYAVCGLNQTSWPLMGEVAAGSQEDVTLEPGQAVRIFTGATIPINTEAVIIQENITLTDKGISVDRPPKASANIRRQGEEIKVGDLLLRKNTALNPVHLALLSSQGHADVSVYARLKICVFSSGDELLEPGHALKKSQIYDSNRLMIQSCLAACPFEVFDGGILKDDPYVIKEALLKASEEMDVIICSAGASVGDRDYIKSVVEEIGSLKHWKLNIKPGKPMAWGECGKSKIFMLPGNPAASFVTFQQMVLPALKMMSGVEQNQAEPKFIYTKVNFSLDKTSNRRQFLKVALEPDATYGTCANLLGHQASHMISSLANSDALLEIPENTTVTKGIMLKAFLISFK